MCDGTFGKKVEIIRELIRIEQPAETRDYLHRHLVWGEEELRVYRDRLCRLKGSTNI